MDQRLCVAHPVRQKGEVDKSRIFNTAVESACKDKPIIIDWSYPDICKPADFDPPHVVLICMRHHQHASNLLFVQWRAQIATWTEIGHEVKMLVYRPEGHSGGSGLYVASKVSVHSRGADKEFYYPNVGLDQSDYHQQLASELRLFLPC